MKKIAVCLALVLLLALCACTAGQSGTITGFERTGQAAPPTSCQACQAHPRHGHHKIHKDDAAADNNEGDADYLDKPQETDIALCKEHLSKTITGHLNLELTRLLQFQVECCAYMETGMVLNWFRTGFDESPENMAQLLGTVVPRELYNLPRVAPPSGAFGSMSPKETRQTLARAAR